MKKYDVYLQFESHRHEDYTLECDTDEEAIDEAKDIIIDGFTSILEGSPYGTSYCYLNITEGCRKVYDGTLYPCLDGVTKNIEA